jgi:DNA-binding HxlR family transcriptional regulator
VYNRAVTMKMDGQLLPLDAWQRDRCSIAMAMDVVGTRSAILLLREAFYGATRFDEFVQRIGITETVAAARLRELVDAGVFSKQPYRSPGQRTRSEYVLTEKGKALLPTVLALMQWGDSYLQDDGGPLEVVDDQTGSSVRVQLRTDEGVEVGLDDLLVRVNRKCGTPAEA